MVVTVDADRQQLIVVGVRGSAASLAALRWAAHEAGLRGARLHVVRAWEDQAPQAAPYAHLHGRVRAAVGCEDRGIAVTRLRDAVWAVFGDHSPPTVTVEFAEGLAARVLLDRAVGADLLVVGAAINPGPDGISPVAQACLRHAPCPVTVVTVEAWGGSGPGTQGHPGAVRPMTVGARTLPETAGSGGG